MMNGAQGALRSCIVGIRNPTNHPGETSRELGRGGGGGRLSSYQAELVEYVKALGGVIFRTL